jgi:hypothetical protein
MPRWRIDIVVAGFFALCLLDWLLELCLIELLSRGIPGLGSQLVRPRLPSGISGEFIQRSQVRDVLFAGRRSRSYFACVLLVFSHFQ